VKAIRGFSDFGFSYVYVIFEDGTDPYWARSRVQRIPGQDRAAAPGRRADGAGAGRDGRGLGLPVRARGPQRQRRPRASCARFQDWTLRTWLQSVPGVAEVAAFGGVQKQYR
jgi:Cu(I)/Ag(I) efflux system membrane protein CusA/SilA